MLANVIMSLFSPSRYEISKYDGYNIGILRDRFRGLSILKNRDGDADLMVGLAFLGEIGYFKELALAKDMNEDSYKTLLKSIEQKKYYDGTNK